MPEVGGGHLTLAPEWLDPEDNGGAVKRFQLGLHYSLIYCDRPPRPAVTALLPPSGLLHSATYRVFMWIAESE